MFFFWILQFCCMPDRGCLHEQPSVKTLRSETLMSCPKQKHHTCVTAFSFLRDPIWGEEDKKAGIWTTLDSTCLSPLWSSYISLVHHCDKSSFLYVLWNAFRVFVFNRCEKRAKAGLGIKFEFWEEILKKKSSMFRKLGKMLSLSYAKQLLHSFFSKKWLIAIC